MNTVTFKQLSYSYTLNVVPIFSFLVDYHAYRPTVKPGLAVTLNKRSPYKLNMYSFYFNTCLLSILLNVFSYCLIAFARSVWHDEFYVIVIHVSGAIYYVLFM